MKEAIEKIEQFIAIGKPTMIFTPNAELIVRANKEEYLRNISIGDKYACSKLCGSEKAKETNIKNI